MRSTTAARGAAAPSAIPTGVLATPFEVVPAPCHKRGLARLCALVEELDAERVVVGLPLTLAGGESAQTREARAFAATLQRAAGGAGRALRRALHDEAGRAPRRVGARGRAGGGAPAGELARRAAAGQPTDETSSVMPESGERTEAEREAARLERERRRRAGRSRRRAAGRGAKSRAGCSAGAGAGRTVGAHAESPKTRAPTTATATGTATATATATGPRPARPPPGGAAGPTDRDGRPTRLVAGGWRDGLSRWRCCWSQSSLSGSWFELFQPFQGSGHGSVLVTVPHDATASEIGDMLAREGVVSSGSSSSCARRSPATAASWSPARYRCRSTPATATR